MDRKSKNQPLSTKVGIYASNPVRGWCAGNAVKGRDERQNRAPLTAFPAQTDISVFFALDSSGRRHRQDDTSGTGAVWKGHMCVCQAAYASQMHVAAAAIHAKPWMYVISMTYLLYQLPSA